MRASAFVAETRTTVREVITVARMLIAVSSSTRL
jgi:hypothetical protein